MRFGRARREGLFFFFMSVVLMLQKDTHSFELERANKKLLANTKP